MLRHLLLLFLPFVALALYTPNGPVEPLTSSTFDSKVVNSDEGTVYMVEFFAPWCGHCKNLAPEWEKAARALKGFVHVAAVDATAEQALASRYQVGGYPTILIFGVNSKTKPDKYEGGRTADAIVDAGLKLIRDAVKQKLSGKKKGSSEKSSSGGSHEEDSHKKEGPSEVIELTDANFESMVLESSEPWLVEFFAPWCGHCKNLAPEYASASVDLKGTVKLGAVDATLHKELAQKYGVSGYPTLKFFPPSVDSKQSPIDYEGGRISSAIVKWCVEKLDELGVAPEIAEGTSEKTMKENCYSKKLCVVAVMPHLSEGGAAARNDYIEVVKTAAKNVRGKPMSFVWIQGTVQSEFEHTFGIGGAGYPALITISASKMRHSTHRRAFTADHVTTFLKDVFDGKEKSTPFKELPPFHEIQPWDGSEYVPPVEETE